LYDTRTGRRVGMASVGFTQEQAEQQLADLRERDARSKRPDLHDLIPHLAVVELTAETWGSNPGDLIGSVVEKDS
jgi:hypothetical protein